MYIIVIDINDTSFNITRYLFCVYHCTDVSFSLSTVQRAKDLLTKGKHSECDSLVTLANISSFRDDLSIYKIKCVQHLKYMKINFIIRSLQSPNARSILSAITSWDLSIIHLSSVFSHRRVLHHVSYLPTRYSRVRADTEWPRIPRLF